VDNIEKQFRWADIIIKPNEGVILLQQKWNYKWLKSSSAPEWDDEEKDNFHIAAEDQIQSVWSSNANVSVSGSSNFAKQHKARNFKIIVDIRRVTAKEHWRVHVRKVSKMFPPNSGAVVNWGARLIKLNSNSLRVGKRCYKSMCYKQKVVAHEFGHTVYHLIHRGKFENTDEYHKGHRHSTDRASIMHTGSQLRVRHLRNLIDSLNEMIPDTTFSIENVSTQNILRPA
jgi:hypothetical protein